MKTEIATAYLQPPPPPAKLLPCPALLARMATARAVALIAPAGFGKTAVLGGAWRAARAMGAEVSWLTLAREWDTPERLLGALETACGGAGAGMDPEMPWSARLAALVNGWEGRKTPPHIFLDGLEAVPPEARPVLRAFCDTVSYVAHLRVAGRSGADLGLRKKALSGDLDWLGPEALAIQADALAAAGLAGPAAERLYQETDGWPAALALALAPALNSADAPGADGIKPLDLPVRKDLADYCEEEVFANLAPAHCDLLMDLGVLGRFTGESASTLCGRPDAGRLIESFAAENLFLEIPAGAGEWMRLMPLFARLGRERLMRRDPARVRMLHRKAAQWALDRGVFEEALRHAHQVGEPDFVAEIVEGMGGWRLGLLGGPKAFPSTGTLAGAGDTRFPQLVLGEIYFLAQSGRVGAARAAFERLRGSTAGFRRLAQAEKVEDFAAYARTLDVTLRLYEDRPVRLADLKALAGNGSGDPDADGPMAGSAASLLALSQINLGRYEAAVETAEAGLQRVAGHGADLIEYFLRMKLGAAAVAVGRLDKAALHLESALHLAERVYGPGSGEMSAARILRASAHYEADETAAATALFDGALEPLAPANGWFELYTEGFSAAAALAALTGAGGRLARVIDECRLVARKRKLARLARLADIVEVREWVRSGEPEAALARAGEPGFRALLAPRRAISPWRGRLAVLAIVEWARTLAALGRYAEAHQALGRLDPASFGDLRQRLTVHAIHTGVSFRLGRPAEAAAHLDAALTLAGRAGFVRRLRNHRGELWEAFQWALGEGHRIAPGTLALGETLLGGEEPPELAAPARRKRPAASPVYPLSPREMNVLELLSEGCSTKEIARRLSIAEGTVKTHRKKIYEKLGANNRSSALARARESQLL